MKEELSFKKLTGLVFFFLRLFFIQLKFIKLQYKIKKNLNKIIFSDSLSEISPFLTESLLQKPLVYIPIVEAFLNKLYFKFNKKKITITFDLKKSLKEKFISPKDLKIEFIEEIVFIEGLVVYFSEIKTKIKSFVFFCLLSCKLFIPKNTNKLKKINFNSRKFSRENFLELDYRLSEFIDYQYVVIQDLPDKLSFGVPPRQIVVILKEDLVNSCKIGQSVKLCGIYNFLEISKFNLKKNSIRDIVNCLSVSSNEKHFSLKNLKCDIILMKNFSLLFDNFNRLVSMVIPIAGYQLLIRKGIVFFLTGGKCKKSFKKKLKNINILLSGDLNVYKTLFFQFIIQFFPESVFITFKNVQTSDASISNLNFLIISNNKTICIDGLENLCEFDKVALNNILEYQKITLHVENYFYTLKTKCKIIATANSIFKKYNCGKSIQSNINLQKSTILKFDLVFLLLDHIDKRKDKKFAAQLIDCDFTLSSNFTLVKKKKPKRIFFSINFVRLLVNFCKSTIFPYLGDDVIGYMLKNYTQIKIFRNKQIKYIESLVKMTLIYTRINFRLIAKKKDVDFVNKYLTEITQTNRNNIIKQQKKVRKFLAKKTGSLSYVFFLRKKFLHGYKKIYFLKKYIFFTRIGTVYDYRLFLFKIKHLSGIKKISFLEKTIFEWIVYKQCLVFKKVLIKI